MAQLKISTGLTHRANRPVTYGEIIVNFDQNCIATIEEKWKDYLLSVDESLNVLDEKGIKEVEKKTKEEHEIDFYRSEYEIQKSIIEKLEKENAALKLSLKRAEDKAQDLMQNKAEEVEKSAVKQVEEKIEKKPLSDAAKAKKQETLNVLKKSLESKTLEELKEVAKNNSVEKECASFKTKEEYVDFFIKKSSEQ